MKPNVNIALILLFVGVVTLTSTAAPRVEARVDRRIETFSIIARIAGYEEYVRNDFKSYASDVDAHFEKYKKHPAILRAIQLRESNGIGFDAVMAMAIHLDSAPEFAPRIPFSGMVPEKRWGQKNAEEFAVLVRQFYKDAECESFFKAHEDMYRLAEGRFQKLLEKVNFQWYESFYGEVPKGEFRICLGLLNGGGNYGPKIVFPDGREESYAIMGTWLMDADGKPNYSERVLPTVIHEFNHSYVNHLNYERRKELEKAGRLVFKPVAKQMASQAYGDWDTVLNEALVRAGVVMYLRQNDPNPEMAVRQLQSEQARGFIWVDELVGKLEEYEKKRQDYPTLRSYVPQLVAYYNELSSRIDAKVTAYSEARPRVAGMREIANGAVDVSPKLTTLTILFDRPMNTKGGYSFNLGSPGQDAFPIEKVLGFGEDGKSITVQLKLQPDKDYEFVITEVSFRSATGYPLVPLKVGFHTAKE